jgi:TolB-like protein
MNSRRALLSMTAVAVIALLLPAQTAIRALALELRQGQIGFVISGAAGQQPKLGIPEFVVAEGDADLKAGAKTVSSVLYSDLEFEREFYLIEQARSASIPLADSPDTLAVDQWADLGADYVVMGTARRTGDALVVEVRVVGAAEPMHARLPATSPTTRQLLAEEGARVRALHRRRDPLQLRRLDGVAQSMLAFNSDRDGEVQSDRMAVS